jgi:hypothetical protein
MFVVVVFASDIIIMVGSEVNRHLPRPSLQIYSPKSRSLKRDTSSPPIIAAHHRKILRASKLVTSSDYPRLGCCVVQGARSPLDKSEDGHFNIVIAYLVPPAGKGDRRNRRFRDPDLELELTCEIPWRKTMNKWKMIKLENMDCMGDDVYKL